jgi:hypothetical protein
MMIIKGNYGTKVVCASFDTKWRKKKNTLRKGKEKKYIEKFVVVFLINTSLVGSDY